MILAHVVENFIREALNKAPCPLPIGVGGRLRRASGYLKFMGSRLRGNDKNVLDQTFLR